MSREKTKMKEFDRLEAIFWIGITAVILIAAYFNK